MRMHALELLRSHVRVVFLTAAYSHTEKTTFSTLLSLSFQQYQMAYDEGSQTEAEADLSPKARCDRSNATSGPSQVLACLVFFDNTLDVAGSLDIALGERL